MTPGYGLHVVTQSEEAGVRNIPAPICPLGCPQEDSSILCMTTGLEGPGRAHQMDSAELEGPGRTPTRGGPLRDAR